ncbi:hypothetical protein PYJP_14810 [Pyrofollis japonicus]|uniref:hypothetical protein n=1 Tax=Pyrofollis japonicus TaxID=3060460 RepID=UPI00295B9008|nr:hypothetical protein [Pyrofollis japonicus]BEP18129.1 hypothetical protein PYJP_14810 [Pyrofollis japonicus]
MKNSSSQGDYQVKVIYVTRCDEKAFLRAALGLSSALFLSNSIRYWVTYEAMINERIRGNCLRYVLSVDGKRVRWLRPGEKNLQGFINTIKNGKPWPGVVLRKVDNEMVSQKVGCLNIISYLKGQETCPNCIMLDEEEVKDIGLKPWWLLSAIMVVNDEQCRKRC